MSKIIEKKMRLSVSSSCSSKCSISDPRRLRTLSRLISLLATKMKTIERIPEQYPLHCTVLPTHVDEIVSILEVLETPSLPPSWQASPSLQLSPPSPPTPVRSVPKLPLLFNVNTTAHTPHSRHMVSAMCDSPIRPSPIRQGVHAERCQKRLSVSLVDGSESNTPLHLPLQIKKRLYWRDIGTQTMPSCMYLGTSIVVAVAEIVVSNMCERGEMEYTDLLLCACVCKEWKQSVYSSLHMLRCVYRTCLKRVSVMVVFVHMFHVLISVSVHFWFEGRLEVCTCQILKCLIFPDSSILFPGD